MAARDEAEGEVEQGEVVGRLLFQRIKIARKRLSQECVRSTTRAGRICAAQILAELGDVRERFPTEDQLAAEAVVCPVTHASGRSRGVVVRWACNHRLRQAVTCFADNSRHASAPLHRPSPMPPCGTDRCAMAAGIYDEARAWVRVLWRAWKDAKSYDPTRHAVLKNAA